MYAGAIDGRRDNEESDFGGDTYPKHSHIDTVALRHINLEPIDERKQQQKDQSYTLGSNQVRYR